MSLAPNQVYRVILSWLDQAVYRGSRRRHGETI